MNKSMKLLFDVHCVGQYLSNKAEIEKNGYSLICVGQHPDLLQDMKDPDIADYAAKNGYMIVTKDVDFVSLCMERKIPVGVLKGNRLFVISDEQKLFGGKPANTLFTP